MEKFTLGFMALRQIEAKEAAEDRMGELYAMLASGVVGVIMAGTFLYSLCLYY